MLRRDPIFQALDPSVLSSGIQKDQQDLKKILWAEAENVRFYSGKVTRNVPPSLIYQPATDTIRGLSQQRAPNGVRWVWAASGGKVYRWYGPAAELIWDSGAWQVDETSTQEPTFFDFIHWGDWTIVNNGAGALKIYKPGVGLSDLSADAPLAPVKLMKKLNFLMAYGVGVRGTSVAWSAADVIDEWIGTTSNEAGELSIDDFDTRIKAVGRLGQYHSVYAEDQMAVVSYISSPFYFGQQVKLDGIGAVGKNAVTGDQSGNVGVGRGGVWWTDGNSAKYLDEGWLHDYLQKEVNWSQASKIVAARNEFTGCFDFHFPMRESFNLNEGWSYDPRTGGWSPIPAVQMQDERKVLLRPIVGTSDGKVQLLSDSPAVAAPLSLLTKPLLMQVKEQTGLFSCHTDSRIDEVELLMHEATGVEFRLESATQMEGPWTESAWQTVQPRGATYKIEQMASGVYWRLRFRSVVVNWQMDLQGFLLFGTIEGSKRT